MFQRGSTLVVVNIIIKKTRGTSLQKMYMLCRLLIMAWSSNRRKVVINFQQDLVSNLGIIPRRPNGISRGKRARKECLSFYQVKWVSSHHNSRVANMITPFQDSQIQGFRIIRKKITQSFLLAIGSSKLNLKTRTISRSRVCTWQWTTTHLSLQSLICIQSHQLQVIAENEIYFNRLSN